MPVSFRIFAEGSAPTRRVKGSTAAAETGASDWGTRRSSGTARSMMRGRVVVVGEGGPGAGSAEERVSRDRGLRADPGARPEHLEARAAEMPAVPHWD